MRGEAQDSVRAFRGWDHGTWWLRGHVPDMQAICAVRSYDCGARDEPELEFVEDDEFIVTRGWWRSVRDAGLYGCWAQCAQGDEGAEAWTFVKISIPRWRLSARKRKEQRTA